MTINKLPSAQFIRYSRQIMLDGWGEQTQLNLSARRIVIIGAGGLGNIAASYLAGAGVGQLTIIDGDEVELSNLPRQIAFDIDSIENSKVYELANRLRQQNDQIEIVALHDYIDDDNACRLIKSCDLVLDCTDNIDTRHLINRLCVSKGLALLSASVAKWQGQLMLVDPKSPEFGCYHCLFPKIGTERSQNSCSELGVVGPMVGVLGSLQAAQALRYLTAAPSDSAGQLVSKFICINGSDLSVQSFNRTRDSQCQVCAQNHRVGDGLAHVKDLRHA